MVAWKILKMPLKKKLVKFGIKSAVSLKIRLNFYLTGAAKADREAVAVMAASAILSLTTPAYLSRNFPDLADPIHTETVIAGQWIILPQWGRLFRPSSLAKLFRFVP